MARMVKLYHHEKMLILRCILPPPQKKLNFLQKKNLTSHPLENLEQGTQVTENNFNPLKNP